MWNGLTDSFKKGTKIFVLAALVLLVYPLSGQARDVDYRGSEVSVRVTPGEPTQINFPNTVAGGFKKRYSSLSLEKNDKDLVIFASEALTISGEAIIVRLKNGQSFSIRIRRATQDEPRDDVIRMHDERNVFVDQDEEDPPSKERSFSYAKATQVSGFMREMILATEFGKKSIPGYRVSERYRGETILNDGAIVAKIDRIFMGPTLWGYVLDAANQLDHSQKINPASFRIDGTRAISVQNWELSPRPLTVEQQYAGKDKSKVYIITKAMKTN